jgi:hypothetical protein
MAEQATSLPGKIAEQASSIPGKIAAASATWKQRAFENLILALVSAVSWMYRLVWAYVGLPYWCHVCINVIPIVITALVYLRSGTFIRNMKAHRLTLVAFYNQHKMQRDLQHIKLIDDVLRYRNPGREWHFVLLQVIAMPFPVVTWWLTPWSAWLDSVEMPDLSTLMPGDPAAAPPGLAAPAVDTVVAGPGPDPVAPPVSGVEIPYHYNYSLGGGRPILGVSPVPPQTSEQLMNATYGAGVPFHFESFRLMSKLSDKMRKIFSRMEEVEKEVKESRRHFRRKRRYNYDADNFDTYGEFQDAGDCRPSDNKRVRMNWVFQDEPCSCDYNEDEYEDIKQVDWPEWDELDDRVEYNMGKRFGLDLFSHEPREHKRDDYSPKYMEAKRKKNKGKEKEEDVPTTIAAVQESMNDSSTIVPIPVSSPPVHIAQPKRVRFEPVPESQLPNSIKHVNALQCTVLISNQPYCNITPIAGGFLTCKHSDTEGLMALAKGETVLIRFGTLLLSYPVPSYKRYDLGDDLRYVACFLPGVQQNKCSRMAIPKQGTQVMMRSHLDAVHTTQGTITIAEASGRCQATYSSQNGDCGSPVVSGENILGIHCAGGSTTNMFEGFTDDHIKFFREKFNKGSNPPAKTIGSPESARRRTRYGRPNPVAAISGGKRRGGAVAAQ